MTSRIVHCSGARVSRKGVAAMLHYHPKLTGRLVRIFCLLVPDLQYEDTIGALAELEAMGCDPVGHKT